MIAAEEPVQNAARRVGKHPSGRTGLDMKRCSILAAGLLALAAVPTLAAPISFPECPAVGLNTTGCELLITVTATSNGIATAFNVAASSPDLGSFNGGFSTLIGVLNLAPGVLRRVEFTVAPGFGSFAFSRHGACSGTGSPLAAFYSPGPTAAQCLNGQYWTTDAMDYAAAGVTFCSFGLANACMLVGAADGLPSGGSAWFSLPGALTAGDITSAPEPASLVLIGTGLGALCFIRRRKP